MANCSFDVVSEVDLQEVQNAVDQAQREIATRYDFKGTQCDLELDKKKPAITITADDEMKMGAVIDVLITRLVKRAVPTKSMVYGKTEPTGRVLKKEITIQQGLNKEQAKEVTQLLKKINGKLQAQIMGEQVRVVGKSRDELQQAIQGMNAANFDFDLQFTNYR